MRPLKDFEIGLMFWASGDAEQDIAFVRSFGLQAGQLGFPGGLSLHGIKATWHAALRRNSDFQIETAFCSYAGEDYTDIPTIARTVGLVPLHERAQRIARTEEVAAVAAELGIFTVACHIGFVPEQRMSPEYIDLCRVARDLCRALSSQRQTFALETGQEPAHLLLAFIEDVGESNLKINFDPANMLLYGTGDPIEAVRVLGDHIVSVHCKDGVPPPQGDNRTLGMERPLGMGQVDFAAFLNMLRRCGYRGILSIEREESDIAERNRNIRSGIDFLRGVLKTVSY